MSKLINDIKDFKGSVLGVGYLKDQILKALDKNDYIEVNLLTNDIKSVIIKSKENKEIRKNRKKGKTFSIKKIKKEFKNKRPDYIICNINDEMRFLRTFIKDSLYITNEKLYVFSQDDKVDLEEITRKYRRYNKNIKVYKDYIVIDNINYKNNIFKNIWIAFVDFFVSIYDFIGSIMAS